MRCRQCGLELDERDRLRNGAYQCPECGAIHHTASSSRTSPSPWRKRRRGGFAPAGNPLTRSYFGLPMWAWIAITLAVVIAAIVLTKVLGGPAEPSEMPVPADLPTLETVAPGDTQAEASAEPTEPAGAEVTPIVPASTGSTGVGLNDFLVGFDWALNYLNFNGSLTLGTTETATNGDAVQHYTFGDWIDLTLTVDSSTNQIRSGTITARLTGGSTDTMPIDAAFVAMIYGLDNTISAGDVRTEIEAMIADNTRVYERNSFSATLTNGTSSDYTLDVTGKLS